MIPVSDRDLFIINEFKKALRKYAGEAVLNLDEKFQHKFDFFMQAHEVIIDKVGNHIPPNRWSYYRIGLVKEGSADYTVGIYKFKAQKIRWLSFHQGLSVPVPGTLRARDTLFYSTSIFFFKTIFLTSIFKTKGYFSRPSSLIWNLLTNRQRR